MGCGSSAAQAETQAVDSGEPSDEDGKPTLLRLETNATTFTDQEDLDVLPANEIDAEEKDHRYPTMGISLWALRHFATQFSAELDGKTTKEVCEEIIMPLTAGDANPGGPCSYVHVLSELNAYSEGRGHAVNEATIFVSHSWGNNFLDLVSALESKMAAFSESQAGEWLWVDVFCINQHCPPPDVDSWLLALRHTIAKIGHLVLVMEPWIGTRHPPALPGSGGAGSPAALTAPHDALHPPPPPADSPLHRMWCLWELVCISAHNGDLDMITGASSDPELLLQALTKDFDALTDAFSRVDFAAAKTSRAEDRDVILRGIERLREEMGWGAGWEVVNARLSHMLTRWIASCGDVAPLQVENPAVGSGKQGKLLQKLGTLLRRAGRLRQVVALYRRVLTYWQGQMHGSNAHAPAPAGGGRHSGAPLHPKGSENAVFAKQRLATALTHLCQSERDQHAVFEARILFEEVFRDLSAQFGPESPEALLATNSQAVLALVDAQSYDGGAAEVHKAEALLTSVVASWRRLGRDAELCAAMNNLGACLAAQQQEGRLQEAVVVYIEALAVAERAHGPKTNHPEAVEIMCSLADCQNTAGEAEKAEELYRKLIPRLRVYYGVQNVRTCTMQYNLALLLETMGSTALAARNFEAASRGFTATLEELKRTGGDAAAFTAVQKLVSAKQKAMWLTATKKAMEQRESAEECSDLNKDIFSAWRDAARTKGLLQRLSTPRAAGGTDDAEGQFVYPAGRAFSGSAAPGLKPLGRGSAQDMHRAFAAVGSLSASGREKVSRAIRVSALGVEDDDVDEGADEGEGEGAADVPAGEDSKRNGDGAAGATTGAADEEGAGSNGPGGAMAGGSGRAGSSSPPPPLGGGGDASSEAEGDGAEDAAGAGKEESGLAADDAPAHAEETISGEG